MSWNDFVTMFQDTVDFIDKHAIVNAIIIGILAWRSKSFTDKKLEEYKSFANKELENYKLKNQSDLEKVKSDLALNLEVSKRYSLEQFKLYNELWMSLYDLKIRGNKLWDVASVNNVKAFAEQLKRTENQIDRHSLLIEEQHYLNLKKLIKSFYQFKFGKTTLFELRNNNSNNHDSQLQIDQIKEVIHQNKELKDDYSSLLDYLKEDFKRQIRGSKLVGVIAV